MHLSLTAAALLLTFGPATAFSATVHKCQDAQGNITFTHLGCPPEHALEIHVLNTLTPTGAAVTEKTGKPARISKQPTRAKTQGMSDNPAAVVGIGLRADGCGNVLTPAARRKAMIDKEARAGMSQTDVQSMLGKPDSISSQNGKVRFNYVDKQRDRKRTVSFDADGCVKP